jgi:hypothetical protein
MAAIAAAHVPTRRRSTEVAVPRLDPAKMDVRFQRLCEDPNYVKFDKVHSVNVAPLLI